MGEVEGECSIVIANLRLGDELLALGRTLDTSFYALAILTWLLQTSCSGDKEVGSERTSCRPREREVYNLTRVTSHNASRVSNLPALPLFSAEHSEQKSVSLCFPSLLTIPSLPTKPCPSQSSRAPPRSPPSYPPESTRLNPYRAASRFDPMGCSAKDGRRGTSRCRGGSGEFRGRNLRVRSAR